MLILQLWFIAILFSFMPSWQGFKGLIFYPFAVLFCLLGPRLLLGANNKKETLSPLHFAVIVYLIIALCSLIPSGRSASDGLLEFSRLLIYFSLIVCLSRLSISQFLKLASLSTFSAALIGFFNWLNLGNIN